MIDNTIADLSMKEFTGDERAVLIAEKHVIESYLGKLMTIMIGDKAETREEIAICRKMKDTGIEMLDNFKKENDKKGEALAET